MIRKQKKQDQSYLEAALQRLILRFDLPNPVWEYKFHNYRFDAGYPKAKVFIEVDGGTYNGGDHVRGVGYRRDCEKNNLAQLEGWVVLRADREMVFTEDFAMMIKQTLMMRIRNARKQANCSCGALR